MGPAMGREDWIAAFEYEKDMFVSLWEYLFDTRPNDDDQPEAGKMADRVRDALVESALLHTRVLVEFFLGSSQKRGDDVWVRDLWPDFRSERTTELLRGVWGAGDGSHRSNVNKRLAHFTNKRGAGADWTPLHDSVVPMLSILISELELHIHDKTTPSA